MAVHKAASAVSRGFHSMGWRAVNPAVPPRHFSASIMRSERSELCNSDDAAKKAKTLQRSIPLKGAEGPAKPPLRRLTA